MTRPGDDYIYVICSVCNGKFHRKDTAKVTDRYNTQNGLIVCRWDLDEVNPQAYPNRHLVEHPPSQPELLTGPATIEYVGTEFDNRLPGKPLIPNAIPSATGVGVDLYWQAPIDQGNSEIQGYRIERAEPQYSTYTILSAISSSPIPYFNDETANQETYYSYRIAAINTFGMGPYSEEFLYPVSNVIWEDINYLVISQNGDVLSTGSGVGIRLNHIDAGVI